MKTETVEIRTLKELWLGIFCWGFLAEIVGFFFVKNHFFAYTTGILLGIVSASAMAYHMFWALDRGLGESQEVAEKYIRKQSVIRYVAVVIVMALVMFFSEWVNPLSWFLALMGLKVAAYLQPLTHRILLGKKGILLEKEQEKALQREYAESLLEEEDEEEEENVCVSAKGAE